MKRRGLLLASMCAALTLAGVSGCSQPQAKPSTFFDVTVSDNRTCLMIGEKVELNVTMYGTTSQDVTFKSSNERVLSVSETGICEALSAGMANVTITSVSNPELTKEISLEVTKSFGQRNPQLQEMADSMENYNYGAGVRYSGGIKVDIGVGKAMGMVALSDINLPLDIEVQQNETETNVHVRADVERLINQDGMEKFISVPLILKKTLGSLLNKEFDNYLSDSHFKDSKYLDLYAFNGLDYYVANTRNFGTEEAPNYRPFSIGQGNFLSLLSPLAGTLLGALGGGNSDGAQEETGGLDIGSLLTKDGILKLTSTIYGFLDVEGGTATDDFTKLALNPSALGLINSIWTGIGGPLDFEFGGIAIEGWYLPTQLTEISLLVNNKAEGENKFSGLELSIKGLNPDGEEYEFVNIGLEQPTILSADYMSGEKEKIMNYVEAQSAPLLYGKTDTTTTVLDALKTSKNLVDIQNTYNASESTKIADTMANLISLYDHVDNSYAKDLLYPLGIDLKALTKYGNELILKGYVNTNTLNDSVTEGEFIIDHYLNKEVQEHTVTFTSDNPEIISIDENGVFKAHGKIFDGSVSNGNKKVTDNSVKLQAKVEYKEGDADKTKTFTAYGVKYEGDKLIFPSTKSTIKDHAILDKATHDLNLSSNSTFNLKELIAIPENATDVSYKFTSKDKKIATVDKDGKLTTLTTYLENDEGDVRQLGGITIDVNYTLNGEKVTDNHIFYVKLTDTATGKIDTSKFNDKVTFNAEGNKITATAKTEFDLESVFVPSQTADEGSVQVKFNDMDNLLFKDGSFLNPYYNSYHLDENGKLKTVSSINGKSNYVEITYKINGVTKIERLWFALEVTGEPVQADSKVLEALANESHYESTTNTFKLKLNEFTKVDLGGKEFDNCYVPKLSEGWTFTSFSSSDSAVAKAVNNRGTDKVYYYGINGLKTGKIGACLSLKFNNKTYKLYCYFVIE